MASCIIVRLSLPVMPHPATTPSSRSKVSVRSVGRQTGAILEVKLTDLGTVSSRNKLTAETFLEQPERDQNKEEVACPSAQHCVWLPLGRDVLLRFLYEAPVNNRAAQWLL